MINLIDILSEAEVAKCPAPTQNIELNLQNRQKAINEYGYGVVSMVRKSGDNNKWLYIYNVYDKK